MKKIIIIITLLSILFCGFTNIEPQSKLDGTWISTEDYRSIILFDGDDMRFDYIGINYVASVYKYKIIGHDLIAVKDIDTLKYSIVGISEKELELIYIPRGQSCKYIKK
jgi:hypothetical protein